MPSLTGLSPIVGPAEPEWGPRFVNMHNCYDRDLRNLAKEGFENKDTRKFFNPGASSYWAVNYWPC